MVHVSTRREKGGDYDYEVTWQRLTHTPLWNYFNSPVTSCQLRRADPRCSKSATVAPTIPPCSGCGATRIFEFQLVPQLLHVLAVDRVAATRTPTSATTTTTNNNNNWEAAYGAGGGMNWGNLAVYSCPNAGCVASNQEYVVVQESLDESPMMQPQPRGDVFIRDDAKFDDDDDDEIDDDDDMDEEEECR